MRRGQRLPFAAPAWLTPGRVSGALVCAGLAGLVGEGLREALPRGDWAALASWALLCLWALLPLPMSAGAARGELRAGRVFALLLAWGAAVYWVAQYSGGVDSFPALLQRPPGFSSVGMREPEALLLGVLGYVGLMVANGSAQDDPSFDGLAPVLAWGGPWLVATGGAPGAVGWAAAGLGLGVAVLGLWRAERRLRFLRRVFSHQDAEWRYLPQAAWGERAGLLPLMSSTTEGAGVLARRFSSGEGAYRSAEGLVPVALVGAPELALQSAASQRSALWVGVGVSAACALLLCA